ncbi:MAG: site-specific DNA-methyltransferase [Alphaproteobacteria bacterium]|nr:site-specific DNA-methyltransferase [Alphaproteobacteria bacterium]
MPLLHWLNKARAVTASRECAYRLLEEVPELSCGDAVARGENLLIQGDNLEALKALIPFYAGKVQCICIDPPYNTKSAFAHYDDNLEHSVWLSQIYPRFELLWELLDANGSIWITIDDDESHYLKVMCDEIFGRKKFVANVVWQKRTSPDNRLRLGDAHDNILVYAKCKSAQDIFHQLPMSGVRAKDFKNPDNDPRGPWASTDFTGMTGHATPEQYYTIVAPSGAKHPPPDGRCWAIAVDTFEKLKNDNRVWFGKTGRARPRLKRFLSEVSGQNAWTWWPNADVGHNQEAKKETLALFGGKDNFDTPKPERLISRILHIATKENDLVLDSFLGSGTTIAVAQKMRRRYIGIEAGEHARTHCQPRMQKVIAGEKGGVSESAGWKGGGGFRFCKLGETVFDEHGMLNREVAFPALAAHVWFLETHTPLCAPAKSPLLGVHGGVAYYLLYNGILGDRSIDGGNVLTGRILSALPKIADHSGEIVIYGETSRLGATAMEQRNITFKQIPYDVGAF